MDFHELMTNFRIANRELFNNFFAVGNPGSDERWAWEERFSWVQKTMFQKMVIEPGALLDTKYGQPNPEIRVELTSDKAPASINRDIQSGYWDFPLGEIAKEAHLIFVEFFDWSQVAYRDNRYVIIRIEGWQAHPEVVGKHAMIESQYVRYLADIPEGRQPRGFKISDDVKKSILKEVELAKARKKDG